MEDMYMKKGQTVWREIRDCNNNALERDHSLFSDLKWAGIKAVLRERNDA